MSLTLSVPEILGDLMAAFKSEYPQIFGESGFARDFSSDTAVLGDTITSHIDHVPIVGSYDPNNNGFEAAEQDVTTLIEDVKVTLNLMPCVTIRIPFLTKEASKGINFYKVAIANSAWALGKYFVDNLLYQCVTGNVSSQFSTSPSLVNYDTFDSGLRSQCNLQKMSPTGRFCILNTAMASQLGTDDRTRSKLFVGELNGDKGVRRWDNVAGFDSIKEYTDFPTAAPKVVGLMGEGRLCHVTVRRMKSSAATARALGIPVVMDFIPFTDKDSGLEMMGISYQQTGTGDVYIVAAMLAGLTVGNAGGAVGSQTDNAGCLIVTP